MTREQTKPSLSSEAAAPALGAYRHNRLPFPQSDFLARPSDYRSPLGRTVLARFRREWAAADLVEQHDRAAATRQEYLPAEAQRAYWHEAGLCFVEAAVGTSAATSAGAVR
jgi:hypothetical protein